MQEGSSDEDGDIHLNHYDADRNGRQSLSYDSKDKPFSDMLSKDDDDNKARDDWEVKGSQFWKVPDQYNIDELMAELQ